MKIAMYWHNGRSLGHTAEMAKITKTLVESFSNTYMAGISGAVKGLGMLTSKVDIFKLPSFRIMIGKKDGVILVIKACQWKYYSN